MSRCIYSYVCGWSQLRWNHPRMKNGDLIDPNVRTASYEINLLMLSIDEDNIQCANQQ